MVRPLNMPVNSLDRKPVVTAVSLSCERDELEAEGCWTRVLLELASNWNPTQSREVR
jgi:hypothetical protein